MRKVVIVGLMSVGLAALAACSDHREPPKDTPQVQGVIPQAQLDAMHKAEAVGDQLQQGVDERLDKMDAN